MNEIQRVVLDTNILVSALLWNDLPSTVLGYILQKRLILITCEALLDELREVLTRPKFSSYLSVQEKTVSQLIQDIQTIAEIVEPIDIHPIIEADLDDDVVIACAIGGHAQVIITGDSHLLNLGEYHHIPIYRVEQFLRLFLHEK
jgi:uncharacterized protein